jgi:hypothetical protein
MLGLTANLYPECFVHCAKSLPGPELDMFHRFIVTPSGDIEKGGEKPTLVDGELEKERQLLLKEAELRDGVQMITIKEDYLASPEKSPANSLESEALVESTEPMSEDDEKSSEYIKITSSK